MVFRVSSPNPALANNDGGVLGNGPRAAVFLGDDSRGSEHHNYLTETAVVELDREILHRFDAVV